jgi:hypothetical protein
VYTGGRIFANAKERLIIFFRPDTLCNKLMLETQMQPKPLQFLLRLVIRKCWPIFETLDSGREWAIKAIT